MLRRLFTLLLIVAVIGGIRHFQKREGASPIHGPGAPPLQAVLFDLAKESGGGEVHRLLATPDGHYLIASTPTRIYGLNTWTRGVAWQLDDARGKTALSADGKLLAVGRKLYRTPDGTAIAELLPGEEGAWPIDDLVFSHDGRHVLLKAQNMRAALYALGSPGGGDGLRQLLPIEIPNQPKLDNYSPHESPYAGFSASDSSVFLLSNNRHELQRWSVAQRPQLLATLDFTQRRPLWFPETLSADGVWGVECGLSDLSFTRVDGDYAAVRVELPLEIPKLPGGYSLRHGSACGLSGDGRWLALGLRAESRELKFGYALAIWRAGGERLLLDTGDAQGPTPALPRDVQVQALRFSQDSRSLYVIDQQMNLRAYTLEQPPQMAVLPAEKTLMPGAGGHRVIAAGNKGVAIAHAGKVVWVPLDPFGRRSP